MCSISFTAEYQVLKLCMSCVCFSGIPPELDTLSLSCPAPSMSSVAALSINAVKSLSNMNPCLTSLAIAIDRSPALEECVKCFPNLRKLHLMLDHRMVLDDDDYQVFVSCEFLAHLPELTHLEVSGLSFSDDVVQHFRHLKKLKVLRVLHVVLVLFDYDEVFEALPADLEELQVPPGFQFKSTRVFDRLSRFRRLKYFSGFSLGQVWIVMAQYVCAFCPSPPLP